MENSTINFYELFEQIETLLNRMDSKTKKLQKLQNNILDSINQIEQAFDQIVQINEDEQTTVIMKNFSNKRVKITKQTCFKTDKKRRKKQKKENDKFIHNVKELKKKLNNATSEDEVKTIENAINSIHFSFVTRSSQIHKRDTRPFQICYKGEGYVYEHLLSFDCFTKIEWVAHSNDENDLSIKLNNNHQYFIKEFGEHYDILAENSDGKKFYFEVKSTTKSHKIKKITNCQTKFGHFIDLKDQFYIIASVTNVLNEPSIMYYLFIPGIDINETKIELESGNEANFIQLILDTKFYHSINRD